MYPHTAAAERRLNERQQYAADVEEAKVSLSKELEDALRGDPRITVRTPAWRGNTPACVVLHTELEDNAFLLACLLRDAAAGHSVQTMAQWLLTAACVSHGSNHADAEV